jgi:hypothetical protein
MIRWPEVRVLLGPIENSSDLAPLKMTLFGTGALAQPCRYRLSVVVLLEVCKRSYRISSRCSARGLPSPFPGRRSDDEP